jgi:hypothetical protein
MPQEWIADDERRKKAGVPQEVGFATKPMIAPSRLLKYPPLAFPLLG